MTTITARIVANSIAEDSPTLATMLLRYPRCIHAEFMTHRAFSRNAASSRAIPVEKMIKDVLDDPFVPLVWGKNLKGMQGGEDCSETVMFRTVTEVPTGRSFCREYFSREEAWLKARDNAVEMALGYAEAGYHKQIVNRLLEPFAHITVVVTSTQWSNFFALRQHPDAEPHIHRLANRMSEAMGASTPTLLKSGEWHLPFVKKGYWTVSGYDPQAYDQYVDTGARRVQVETVDLLKLSVARCASTSYKTADGFYMTLERAIALHDKLVGSNPLHASPCEHQAQVDAGQVWFQECGRTPQWAWENPTLGGNLGPGWVQYRKLIPGESL